MKHIVLASLVGALITLAAFAPKGNIPFRTPKGWPQTVYNFKKNPLNEKKIELGRMLFYDPILSRDSTISCASCHLQNTAFTHVDHDLSHGIDGRIGTRNSPALVNMAWSSEFMWDGSVKSLDEQASFPITHPMEMDENMDRLIAKLQRGPYAARFADAFDDKQIKPTYILKAFSQFMLTLVSDNAKYDKVKRGEDTFTVAEAKGYILFQKNCGACHKEPLFTNNSFENNGLIPDDSLKDIGRMKVTRKSEDSLKFKVPTLRNIELSYPYMHDGRFKNLNQVLNNYMRGVQHGPTLSTHLQKGIYFSPDEKGQLIAFLKTLTDKEFLTNPRYSYAGK
jgi:cytochrome c peroxidase